MGKKPIVSVTYENERISIKKQFNLLKMCVTSLLCGPRANLWPFYGFLCKRFSLYIKLYQGWALQPNGSTDPKSLAPVVFLLCQHEQETVSHPECE